MILSWMFELVSNDCQSAMVMTSHILLLLLLLRLFNRLKVRGQPCFLHVSVLSLQVLKWVSQPNREANASHVHSTAARHSCCSSFQQDFALAATLHGLLHCCLDILQVILCPYT